MIQLKSLHQRTFLYILLPTFLLLLVLSWSGFVVLRGVLLEQWGEVAVAKLQQKAVQLDASLHQPKELFSLFHQSEDSQVSRNFFMRIMKQIEDMDGVLSIKVKWPDSLTQEHIPVIAAEVSDRRRGRLPTDRFVVGTPSYNINFIDRTISSISELINSRTDSSGHVEITYSFDILIQRLMELDWWKNHKAYLIDDDGNVLASTGVQMELEDYFPMRAFGTLSKLEKDTLVALQENEYGTVFGPGHPPEAISGYYHLKEAPWTMVVVADGKTVLEPILRFGLSYFLSLAVCILLILLFIRGSMSRVIARIKTVSGAAENLSKGRFGPPLVDNSKDEVGELTGSFNKMTRQLRQRLAMKEAINMARDVQQNLLPQTGYAVDGMTIDGVSLYCDETGGDYYDILNFSDDEKRVAVVVGDVVGHGIGAALLMSSVRAFLRCRVELPGSITDIISDVNNLLCKDTIASGSFITLFCLEIDLSEKTMHWIRAGHEPAFVYSPEDKQFSTLKGKGLALGVEPGWIYESYDISLTDKELIILVGSDGAWEVENSKGEPFGKKRIEQLLMRYSRLSGEEMLKKITDEIDDFKGDEKQEDDITLVVVKVNEKSPSVKR